MDEKTAAEGRPSLQPSPMMLGMKPGLWVLPSSQSTSQVQPLKMWQESLLKWYYWCSQALSWVSWTSTLGKYLHQGPLDFSVSRGSLREATATFRSKTDMAFILEQDQAHKAVQRQLNLREMFRVLDYWCWDGRETGGTHRWHRSHPWRWCMAGGHGRSWTSLWSAEHSRRCIYPR